MECLRADAEFSSISTGTALQVAQGFPRGNSADLTVRRFRSRLEGALHREEVRSRGGR